MRTLGPGRRAPRLAWIALSLAVLLLAAPAAGRADSADSTIFDPPGAGLLYEPPADRESELDRLKDLGADTVRIPVNWRNYAPAPDNFKQPAGFDPTSPRAYPVAPFTVLDRTIKDVKDRGMDVLLSPGGPAPRWATGDHGSGYFRPNATKFGQFVQALGTRYGGSCACGDFPAPQRVSFWSIWNEPNLELFILPQVVHGRVVSARIYRHLFLAAQAGLDATGHGSDTLLLGETSPSRGSRGSNPLDFLRTVLCLDRRWHPVGNCSPIDAAGWAQHPYLPGIAPWARAKKNYIAVGTLGRLTRALRLAYRAGATTRRLPVFVTEFGVESYPEPARRFGVSQQRQAEYLAISEYLLYEDPKVRSYAQFLITDDPGKYSYLSFQTGLRLADGTPKASYYSFPMTLVARELGGGRLLLWGHVRPGGGEHGVELEFRDPEDSAPQPLGSVSTDAQGYFSLRTRGRPGREWRATSEVGLSTLQGPWIREYRFGLPG